MQQAGNIVRQLSFMTARPNAEGAAVCRGQYRRMHDSRDLLLRWGPPLAHCSLIRVRMSFGGHVLMQSRPCAGCPTAGKHGITQYCRSWPVHITF